MLFSLSSLRTFLPLLLLGIALVTISVDAQSIPTPTEGAGFLPPPISQPSVTSTAFDPALTNAGGTTNSAGTFNVVSLSRSSSFVAAEGGLSQTTTFAPGAPSYASGATGTQLFDTDSAATTNQIVAQGSTSQASSSSTAAATGESDAARQGVPVPSTWKGSLTILFSILAGAAWVGAV